MDVQLFEIPGKLLSLSETLSADTEIKGYVSTVVTDANDSVQSFNDMMNSEYQELSKQTYLFCNTDDILLVNWEELKHAVTNMLNAVKAFMDKIKSSEKRIHSYIKQCRASAVEKGPQVDLLRSSKDYMEMKIPELQRIIETLKNEERQYDEEARRFDRRASKLEDEEEERTEAGVWSFEAFTLGSLLFARFTLGGSLVVCTAGGLLAGLNLAKAKDCRTAAKRYSNMAKEKSKTADIITESKMTTEKEIKTLENDIDALIKDANTLAEITAEMFKFIDVLAQIESAFQDEELALEDAILYSSSFRLNQIVFRNMPEGCQIKFEDLKMRLENTRTVLQQYGIVP
ncbi:uncharacterized protein LOC127860436 [Dreissena polymorpha]|uniref:Uncharacterized protein n=1 Tax=Dreissena polymorpha TaxID=45954 RepID=A0A9D3YQT1_DREPO|nr:uncharacterized protein LOC127860436 [Dreissena polymorpha]KAH3705329.1 hypothetical protein DPMN_080398 [Dreissena polymorpha]